MLPPISSQPASSPALATEIARQPFHGVTVDGHQVSGLYDLRDEHAPVERMAQAAVRLLDTLTTEEHARALQQVDSKHWRKWQTSKNNCRTHTYAGLVAADPTTLFRAR